MDGAQPEIRLQTADPENLLEQLKSLYKRAYRDLPLYSYNTDQEIEAYLRWLKRRGEGRLLVAFAGERPVGFVAVDHRWETLNGQRVGEIHEIVVDPEYQGRALGKRLLEAGLELLRAKGLNRFELWVGDRNQKAQAFYLKAGFEPRGSWGKWLRMWREEETNPTPQKERPAP
ncbi:MAG: GNAT family N-acetyltransferase [Clostridia bacterium]|jgi:ribosomal protein S18 acetylase RimI-like enzyme|nr:GNAT family N-acetyltransferase [Clostridia bacterium]MDH7572034.1 GNAT family N-acetyltransferase [Clostridia bacterium]